MNRKIWSHRLAVRTPGSHPGNPGSIPGGITIENSSPFGGLFSISEFIRWIEPVAVRYCPATRGNGAIYPSIPGGITKVKALISAMSFSLMVFSRAELRRLFRGAV